MAYWLNICRKDHPAILRFVVVVVEDRRLKARFYITIVERGRPTSLDEGRGTAGGELGGVFVGILVES
jgi:hypothetical protein